MNQQDPELEGNAAYPVEKFEPSSRTLVSKSEKTDPSFKRLTLRKASYLRGLESYKIHETFKCARYRSPRTLLRHPKLSGSIHSAGQGPLLFVRIHQELSTEIMHTGYDGEISSQIIQSYPFDIDTVYQNRPHPCFDKAEKSER